MRPFSSVSEDLMRFLFCAFVAGAVSVTTVSEFFRPSRGRATSRLTLLAQLRNRSRCRERVTNRRCDADSPVVARLDASDWCGRNVKRNGKRRCEMTLSNRSFAAGVVATLLLTGSLAAAETTPQTTPQTGQQRPETRSQSSDQINHMVEHCTRMMANWSQ